MTDFYQLPENIKENDTRVEIQILNPFEYLPGQNILMHRATQPTFFASAALLDSLLYATLAEYTVVGERYVNEAPSYIFYPMTHLRKSGGQTKHLFISQTSLVVQRMCGFSDDGVSKGDRGHSKTLQGYSRS